MNSEQDRKRMNVEVDRLSSLPDDLIHKILSFIDIQHAIGTSSLSSRWRFIWTSMPCLKFSSEDFPMLPKFSKFVRHVLSGRNNEIDVTSLVLSFRRKASQTFVKKILNYAFSHNVQELTVRCLYDNKNIEFPLSLFRSQSLEHLYLTGCRTSCFIDLTSTWAVPALTTLHLQSIIFCYDNINLFSNCPKLKNLTLNCCQLRGINGFNIRHPRLSNLTVYYIDSDLNVVAPQLKNFRFRSYGSLRSVKFSAESERSVENVNLIFCSFQKSDACKVVDLLQQMHNVKVLTLNSEFVEILSSKVELISHQPSPFANLKSLKIYPEEGVLEGDRDDRSKEKVIIPTEVKNYFLDGSPSATLTMVSREEIIIMKDTTSAKNLMGELEVLLTQEKANINIETGIAYMHEQGNTEPEPKMPQLIQIGESMVQIDKCWEDLSLQIVQRKENASHIIWKLQLIKEIFKKLPASKRDMIQPRFSSLCAEADIVMNKITDSIKTKCDENQNRLSVRFHEIATALQPST